MALTEEQAQEINNKRIISFLSPLLLGIKDDELYVNKYLAPNIKNKTSFDFNKSLILFTDIQAYRHISILGILSTFDRTLKYKVLNLAILLDVWYNESSIISKDDLRTCDLLIIHGTNDGKFGENKARALIELINTRKSFGKLTWIFIHRCSPVEFSKNQPGVLDEINNVYQIKLKDHKSLNMLLSRAEPINLISNIDTNTNETENIRLV